MSALGRIGASLVSPPPAAARPISKTTTAQTQRKSMKAHSLEECLVCNLVLFQHFHRCRERLPHLSPIVCTRLYQSEEGKARRSAGRELIRLRSKSRVKLVSDLEPAPHLFVDLCECRDRDAVCNAVALGE